MLHKKVTVATPSGRVDVTLDIVPDEYEPYAMLGACDDNGDELAQVRVEAGFKLTTETANAWIEADFRKPR
jgi:hypothetical protein